MVLATMNTDTIAYFSMEVGLDAAIPTYSGGLGVLAGDTLRAAADLGVNMVGVTLLYRKGYFQQHLNEDGEQTEQPFQWYPEEHMEPLAQRTAISIEGRQVQIRPWRYIVKGTSGHTVPLYFLDTDLPENEEWDRTLTDRLYGGDERYRLAQEAVLGLGGIAVLQILGYRRIQAYHMNEGHSAFLGAALLRRIASNRENGRPTEDDIETVRWQCVFTTHTPVPEGHDKFPWELVHRVVGGDVTEMLQSTGCALDGRLNMTHLALFFSHYINGVSMRHEQISEGMFPAYPINSITNGVHALTWTSLPFRRIFDIYVPEWRRDNLYLRYAIGIPLAEIREAHAEAKQALFNEIKRRTGVRLDPNVLTLGFARRATPYKRAGFFFQDMQRLKDMVKKVGPIQVVYAGKAHPHDGGGKAMIQEIFRAASSLKDVLPVVYLEEYDLTLAKYMTAGVDIWLNTPQKPREASGTSGMKAALNGVPSLSVLDGWWIEGNIEGVTGWAIGAGWDVESDPLKEIGSLYEKLERTIIPMFYKRPVEFAAMMRAAIAINGSFYNAQRMVRQYLDNAYAGAIGQSY